MPSIVVMNAKGGVGKSTLTMAFAEALSAYHGMRCLLLDADGQLSLSMMVAPGDVLAQNQHEQKSLVPLIYHSVLQHQPVNWQSFVLRNVCDVDDAQSVDLIQGDMDLPLLERELASRQRIGDLRRYIGSLLRELETHYDFVLVDCAPGISVMTEAFLRECGHHIVPVKPDFLSVAGLNYMMRFKENDAQLGFAEHLGIVINQRSLHSDEEADVEHILRNDPALRCFRSTIPQISHVQKASLYEPEGRSFVGKYPAEVGRAIRDVAAEIVARTRLTVDVSQ